MARIASLFQQGHWDKVAAEARAIPARSPELEYFHGVALARLGRWSEAYDRLLAGHRLRRNDERLLVELGGVAFKQERYPEAARWLQKAIRIRPGYSYATDFLGTIYFLQGNLDAALKYWNRSGKPQIVQVQVDPELRVDPVLLDSAFAFAPGSTLLYSELLTSRARTDALGIFSSYDFRLNGREDGKFAVEFAGRERNGWGSTKWEAALSLLRGVAYQAIHPEYFNLAGAAININSMVRWDPQKRRLQTTLSSPLSRNARYRYSFGLDAREERWELRRRSLSLGAFRLRRAAISGGVSSFESGRWSWSTGGELSYRGFQDIAGGAGLQPDALLEGYQLKNTARLSGTLWRFPENRFETGVEVLSETGRIWSRPSRVFERLQVSATAHWLPRMTGDDYGMHGNLRAGRIFGQAPFDELFILGLERDNDLRMRAHIGTADGRKGSAPMGGTYLLSNWEIDKSIYNDGLVRVMLSPFLDAGKITGGLWPRGSLTWLWDTGVQAKLRVLGVRFTLIYGKDLRSGDDTFYVIAGR